MSFCPYCGGLSRHIWTGIGPCPGDAEEMTPIVDDSEMLRAYAETIRLKDAEIERLTALLKYRMYELEELNELKALLARAANALEGKPVYDAVANYHLIDELRKAAQ